MPTNCWKMESITPITSRPRQTSADDHRFCGHDPGRFNFLYCLSCKRVAHNFAQDISACSCLPRDISQRGLSGTVTAALRTAVQGYIPRQTYNASVSIQPAGITGTGNKIVYAVTKSCPKIIANWLNETSFPRIELEPVPQYTLVKALRLNQRHTANNTINNKFRDITCQINRPVLSGFIEVKPSSGQAEPTPK